MDPMQMALMGGGAPMGGAPSFAGQGLPTVQNPGAMPQPHDPAEYGFVASIEALKQLAQIVNRDDERLGNEIDAMANKLNRRFIDRKRQLEQALETMQGRVIAAQM